MEATLQDIFRQGFAHYRERHGVNRDQYQAAMAIMHCRSGELGQEEWLCERDGYVEQQPHSCRHRSCPRCQQVYTQQWLDKTQARLLPCDHYHVVFTLPHELNALWHYNRRWSADRLFKVSAETLRELLNDPRYLGAEVGLLATLHTWGRTATFHPHVHVLVTGGGLAGDCWRPLRKAFLLPVGVVKAKFRGKWLSALNAAYARGELAVPEHWTQGDWRRALRQAARKTWNVRIEGPYRHGSGVVNYLSRYLHGGPMKDHRLVSADARRVSFRYRDHRDGKDKLMTLNSEHFISRMLWHVPVKGQHNVRYYGLYVPGADGQRDEIRRQLGRPVGEEAAAVPKRERVCRLCGAPLVHYRSTWRKISVIRCNRPLEGGEVVQQGVRADRAGVGRSPPVGQADLFLRRDRRLN
jgi:Putative transposase/Transposase zinc-binding domain